MYSANRSVTIFCLKTYNTLQLLHSSPAILDLPFCCFNNCSICEPGFCKFSLNLDRPLASDWQTALFVNL